MTQVFVISDPHFNSGGVLWIPGRRGLWNTTHEHDEALIENWNKVVGKRDVVYVLGDVAYDKPKGYFKHAIYARLNGFKKYVVGGNHDDPEVLACFDKVYGAVDYHYGGRRYLMTHIPIHPQEFYSWVLNIHGHLHHKHVWKGNDPDLRYLNVCCEHVSFTPAPLNVLIEERIEKMKRWGQWPPPEVTRDW